MNLITCLLALSSMASDARPFQPLHIPQAISGTEFELSLHKSSKSFWKGATTKTYGYNQETFWGPTLIWQKGETVHINVHNGLDEPTTTHWHGLHIPAAMDGGPHQLIAAGTTWSPSFKVMNNAGTYWYHPHAHETTQRQLTMGAGGLIIIKDPAEAKLNLPTTYGVDDIPLVLTSRRYYEDNEFSHEGDNDKYGDYPIANGVMDAEVSLPAQMVRLRILNAEIERGYNLGFPDNRTFWVIGTDGGLVDKPIPVTRMKLMVGERVEILVDLSNEKVGNTLDLFSYNANQPFGFPGGEPGTTRPNGGYLNNIDFRALHISVGAATATAIHSLPNELTTNHFPVESEVTKSRTVRITGGRPEFSFDDKPYVMHSTGQTVQLGSVEKWTITNNNIFGHSFHIHDVQFRIVGRSSGVASYEQGWKDTLYVPRGETVSFLAKFEDFASDTDAYMYHCHMANHEDGGLMGEFKVVKDVVNFREPSTHPVTSELSQHAASQASKPAPSVEAISMAKPTVLMFIDAECPCSKDATPFFNALNAKFGDVCQVVGVINATPEVARAWAKKVGCEFNLVADPSLAIISKYGAVSSVYTTLVSASKTIVKAYPGYGKEMLKELAAKIARVSGVKERSISVVGAPDGIVAGCPFATARKGQ